jgi:hypothetical protein
MLIAFQAYIFGLLAMESALINGLIIGFALLWLPFLISSHLYIHVIGVSKGTHVIGVSKVSFRCFGNLQLLDG